jgi:hypothetical protein
MFVPQAANGEVSTVGRCVHLAFTKIELARPKPDGSFEVSFTRVTACRVAYPPYVGFIARLRPGQFPSSGDGRLPSSTNNLLGWVLPPLVICAAASRCGSAGNANAALLHLHAVEAHPISPFLSTAVTSRIFSARDDFLSWPLYSSA